MPKRGLDDAGVGELPHHLGHRKRLRERLREGGEDALPDGEAAAGEVAVERRG